HNGSLPRTQWAFRSTPQQAPAVTFGSRGSSRSDLFACCATGHGRPEGDFRVSDRVRDSRASKGASRKCRFGEDPSLHVLERRTHADDGSNDVMIEKRIEVESLKGKPIETSSHNRGQELVLQSCLEVPFASSSTKLIGFVKYTGRAEQLISPHACMPE